MKISVSDRLLTPCKPSLLFCLSLFTRPDQKYTAFPAACGTQSRNGESNAISAGSTFPSGGNVIDKGFAALHKFIWDINLFGKNKIEKFPAHHKDALSLPEYLRQRFYLHSIVTPAS